MPARTLNLMLGLWLFFTAFALPRTAPSLTNAWIVGILASVFAVAGMLRRERLRFVNTALSAWLLASAFVLPQRSGLAVRSDVVVALGMLIASLVPGSMYSYSSRFGRRTARA
jgi:hypothetical protein